MKLLPAMEEVARLRDRLHRVILEIVQGAMLNGASQAGRRLPNTLNLTLPGLRGESVVIAMDRKGVALSSGSACKSGSPAPSHALLALGLSDADAHCAIRLSLSESTAEEDVEFVGDVLAQVLDEMESTVRFLPCK